MAKQNAVGVPATVDVGGTGATTLTGVLTGNGTSAVTANAVTQYGVVIGGASNAVGSTAVGNVGQVLRSSGAGVNPAYSTATYPATATGTGTLLRADGTNWVATTSTYPTTNAVSTLLYASASNVMGALSTANNGTLVTSNTGVPSVLAGPGTTGQILQSNAAAAPSFSTASYPSTTTVSQILYSSATNIVAGLATANRAVITTGTTGIPVATAIATDGQIIIGSTAGAPAAASLTAGTNITITPGSNSITIAATGGGSVPNYKVYNRSLDFQANETNFAPLELLSGTTIKQMVRAFDQTTEEYVNGVFRVPSDVTTGTVTFTAYVMAKTAAASKNIGLTFAHAARATAEDFDPASPYTDLDSGAVSINATQDFLTLASFTETVTNLGWVANDIVYFKLSRDVSVASNLAADMYLFDFNISIPRA